MEKQDVGQAAKKIRALMREKRYKEVVKIADNLNLNRINNGLLILDIVEAYEKMGDKKAAKTALLNYYDVHGITGRNMMQKLIELCIETRDISNAVGLCMEFENEWPESSISYLMRYQISASAGGSLDERIHYLEKYKEAEFEERWGYELAKLYDKNNQKEECAQVCHEIICFFGTGKYVEKAVQLKERTAGLTEDEINIVESAKHREEEARERREEEERIAREEMARLAEEEERRLKEQEERRKQEEEYRRREEENKYQEEEHRRQQEEYRRQVIAEEQERLRQREEELQRKEEAAMETIYPNREQGFDSAWYETKTLEETEEEYAARKARQAEAEKIRQTEEAARILREKKEADRIAREKKIAQALKTSDRYGQIEKNRSEKIYFDDIFREQEITGEKTKQKKNLSEGNGLFSSFGRMASSVRKSLQPDEDYMEDVDTGGEVEYITIGRDSQAYVEDIEGRMLSELDMLDDEQINELTPTQIKEIYELKILHDVRENIKNLIMDIHEKNHVDISQEELEKFVSQDPYESPLRELAESSSEEEKQTGTAGDAEKSGEQEPEAESTESGSVKKSFAETEKEVIEPAAQSKEPEISSETENTAGKPEKEDLKTETETEASKAEETEDQAETETSKAEPEEIEAEKAETEVETPKTETEEIEEEKAEETEVETPKTETEEIEEEKAEETEAETPKTETEEIEEEKVEKAEAKTSRTETKEIEAEKAEETEAETPKTETEEIEAEKTEAADASVKREDAVSEKSGETVQEEKKAKVKETILDRIADPDENLTVKEFTECITAYAETKGYQVEDTAYMTIAVLAEEMQQKAVPLSLNNAKIMTDDAITRIQKRNPFDRIVDRYSKKHAYLLKDKHFYWRE